MNLDLQWLEGSPDQYIYIYIYICIYSLLLGEIFRESKYQWRFNNYNTNDLKALHATPIYTCNFILYILAGCTFGTDCLSILRIRWHFHFNMRTNQNAGPNGLDLRDKILICGICGKVGIRVAMHADPFFTAVVHTLNPL